MQSSIDRQGLCGIGGPLQRRAAGARKSAGHYAICFPALTIDKTVTYVTWRDIVTFVTAKSVT
jgi:hypothetical protein